MADFSSSRAGSSAHDGRTPATRRPHFSEEKANRNVTTYQQMETDRLIGETKIAKLRALRLAKAESDCEVARIAEANKPSVGSRRRNPPPSRRIDFRQ